MVNKKDSQSKTKPCLMTLRPPCNILSCGPRFRLWLTGWINFDSGYKLIYPHSFEASCVPPSAADSKRGAITRQYATDKSETERRLFMWSCNYRLMHRDVVLEASASARGGLEAVFLAGSSSPRPHTVLPRSWLGLEGSALPRLGSNQST